MLRQQFRFSGKYEGGKAVPDNPEEVRSFFVSQKGRFEAVFNRESEDIVQRQRGYYYGVVIETAAKITGNEKEVIDGVFHKAFLTVNKGQKDEYVRSTSALTKEEYASYIDLCVKRLAEHGVYVSEPSYRNHNAT